MSRKIRITVDRRLIFEAELNDSLSAQALWKRLPLQFKMERWGDEYYGDCGLRVEREPGARDLMEVGELAVWPAGSALCIFFGPTPVSEGSEPRAYEPVNPVGRLLSDPAPLKSLGETISVSIEAA